jgi:hypothetical protein
MSSVWQDLNDSAVLWVCQDALEPFAFGIPPELVDSQHLRQFSRFEVDLIDDLCCCGRGHIVVLCDILDAPALLQLLIDLQVHTVRELAVSGKKADPFIKAFAAFRTDMAPFAQMQDRLIAADGDVPDKLCPIVMDFAGQASTCRAAMQSLLHPQVDMHLLSATFNICDDYIFQLEQFFDTIFVEHWTPPLGFCFAALFYRILAFDALSFSLKLYFRF